MLVAVPSRRMSEDGVVGDCVSAALPFVGQTAVGAFTLALGETFPAASAATTLTTYERPHASPENDAAVVVVEFISTSFTDSRYSATPRSSTAESQATEIADTLEPDTRRLRGASGGLVSAHPVVFTTALVRGEWFPAAS